MLKRSLILTVFLALVACSSIAEAATYDIRVNTSSLVGTPGSLDFQFNPGSLGAQAANLQILNFTSDGTVVGAAAVTGDVTGALTGPLTFDNGTFFNDYFQGFQFGNELSFDVNLYGPALAAPNGTATAGSTFAFSMFSDPAGTVPALTTDAIDGFAVLVNVNLDGTTTVTNLSSQTTVPEPSTVLLLGSGLIGLVGIGRRKLAS